jgi:hypothetical protein
MVSVSVLAELGGRWVQRSVVDTTVAPSKKAVTEMDTSLSGGDESDWISEA